MNINKQLILCCIGLCCVIVEFEYTQLEHAVRLLLQPHIELLSYSVNQLSILNDDRVINALDLISEVYHHLDYSTHVHEDTVSHAIFHSIQSIWQLLMSTLQQSIAEDKRVEKLCRVIKYAIKGSRIQYMSMLSSTVDAMISAYNTSPHSAFLYVLSILIDIFGVTHQMHQLKYIPHIIHQTTTKTLPMIQSVDGYAQYSDVVEDYYELLSRILSRSPEDLIHSTLLIDIIQSSIYGLQQQHRESYAALMTFYSTLFSQAVGKSRFQSYKPARTIPVNTQQILNSILQAHGQSIVSGIVDGIAGILPGM